MIKFNKLTKKTFFVIDQPNAQSVSLAGDFNGWDTQKHPMKKDKKGLWKIDVALNPGAYQFRYFIDNSWWMNDPATGEIPNDQGSANSVVTVEAVVRATRKPAEKKKTAKTAKKMTVKKTKRK